MAKITLKRLKEENARLRSEVELAATINGGLLELNSSMHRKIVKLRAELRELKTEKGVGRVG